MAIEMYFLKTFLFASAVGAISVSYANAANFKVEYVEGTILVQDSEGFGVAPVGAELTAGQQILVKPKSALLLVGSETACFIHIKSPGLYQLSSDMTCEAGHVTSLQSKFVISPANGGSHAVVSAGYGAIEPLLVGGVFIAAVTGTAAWQTLQQKSVSQH